MKQLYLLILSTLLFVSAFAGEKKPKYPNIKWSVAANWLPDGTLPTDNDIIIIPEGYTVRLDGNTNLKKVNVAIEVKGKIVLEDKLWLGENSSIKLLTKNATLETGNKGYLEIDKETKLLSNASIVGPVYADNSTGSVTKSSTGFHTLDILPVTFTNFAVSKSSSSVTIKWSTSKEINADIFQIERSEDGKTWRTVGKVRAVGNSNIVNNYTFTDNALFSNTAFYRIKQIDIDGKFIYTEVKAVINKTNQPGATNNASIIAAGNNVIVNFAKEVKGSVVVRLISFGGQVIAQQSYNQPSQQIVFNKTSINKGNYIVFVSNNHDLNVSKQITL